MPMELPLFFSGISMPVGSVEGSVSAVAYAAFPEAILVRLLPGRMLRSSSYPCKERWSMAREMAKALVCFESAWQNSAVMQHTRP
jgi:hypothetical protein